MNKMVSVMNEIPNLLMITLIISQVLAHKWHRTTEQLNSSWSQLLSKTVSSL